MVSKYQYRGNTIDKDLRDNEPRKGIAEMGWVKPLLSTFCGEAGNRIETAKADLMGGPSERKKPSSRLTSDCVGA